MALESCLQHKTSRGFPATMSPLRFQRRQAWIIQSPPSPHSDFILFMYRSGFLNLSKFDDFSVVKTTRSISNVFYNRNLIDNISQFCSPIPYWNILFVAMSEKKSLYSCYPPGVGRELEERTSMRFWRMTMMLERLDLMVPQRDGHQSFDLSLEARLFCLCRYYLFGVYI